jgi:Rod binding domain-containing protein
VNGPAAVPPAGPPPAGKGDAALHRAAQQLESVFLQQLMQRMDAVDFTDPDSPFAKSPAEDQFQQMLHGALAERAAGGAGIADLVYRQLAPKPRPGAAP